MCAQRSSHLTALAGSTTFGKLPAETLGRLAAGTTEATFKRGSVVCARGDTATGVYVLMLGQLKLSIETPAGDEHVVDILESGDCFGESTALSDRKHFFTAAAVADCHLLHLSRHTLLAELERDLDLARHLIRNLSDRLYRRSTDLETILFRSATSRVARFIFEQLERSPESHISLRMHKGLIASRLNMTQEHFSRTLRSLSSMGAIKVHGKTINVIDEAGLRQLAA